MTQPAKLSNHDGVGNHHVVAPNINLKEVALSLEALLEVRPSPKKTLLTPPDAKNANTRANESTVSIADRAEESELSSELPALATEAPKRCGYG